MKRLLKYGSICLVVIFIAFISFLLHETKDEINADFGSIDGHIQTFYNQNRTAGFSVAVFDADTIYFKKAYGYADIASKKAYTATTQQFVASVSKTLIGVSLIKAQELALLDLDKDINEYLPFKVQNPSYPNSIITLRQLATHTSSLDYNEAVVENLYINDSLKNASLSSIMGAYFDKWEFGKVAYGNYEPGGRFNYSNIGASLAAYCIERQAGMTFDEFTRSYIFDALEMNQSHWFEDKIAKGSHTSYYESNQKNGLDKVNTIGVKMYPSRDLITTIDDLTTFCQAILRRDGRLLSEASYETLLESQLRNSVDNEVIDNSGLFFMIDRNQYGVPYSLTGMNGGDNCINTMMWFDEKTGLGYIFIGNTGQSEFNRVNHIWLFRSLVSLGDHIAFRNDTGCFKNRWHNWSSRIKGVF